MQAHSHDHHVGLPTIQLKFGPVIWHRYCGRRHQRGAPCDLVPVERISKAGNKVVRLAHPEPKKPYQRKKRVRKS